MALTRDFKETVKKRVQTDPVFREELLKEGVQCLVSGDMDTGKTILRDYINATVGFEELGDLTDNSPKSLMRMFGPKGNPQAKNLFEIIECLQKMRRHLFGGKGRSLKNHMFTLPRTATPGVCLALRELAVIPNITAPRFLR